jgi:glutathione S-transferase
MYDLAGADPARRFSPYCWRIRMALAHKNLSVETIPWCYSDKPAIAHSGQDRVPVIEDGDRVIADSWAIAKYLEDTYPDGPSLFGGAAARAAARFINSWADTVQNAGTSTLVAADIVRHLDPRDQEYFHQSRAKRLGMTVEELCANRDARVGAFRQTLEPLRMTLKSQAFLGGGAPLYPDYIVFGGFQWARTISDFALLETDDPIAAWRERMLDLFGGLARKNPWLLTSRAVAQPR